MAPVLEELAMALGQVLEERPRVGPEPGERRQLVRADQDVDGVDLEEADPLGQPTDRGAADGTRRPGVTEALRGEGDPARGRRGQPGKRGGHRGHGTRR